MYKRKGFKTKKVRSNNGERRSLYNYDEIEAFEFLQYDTKSILDMHATPTDIYEKFKNNGQLPKIQWTIIDAKTKTRFLAWSYNRSSFFGFKFLEFTLNWLRSQYSKEDKYPNGYGDRILFWIKKKTGRME